MIDPVSFFKGRRVLVLDIETTGTDQVFDSIIEFGAVEFVDGVKKREYNYMFNNGKSSPFLIKTIHKIKDKDRYDKPSFEESASKICDIMSNSVIVTHNGKKFDIPFLNSYFDRLGLKVVNFKLIDTIILARKLDFKSNSLQYLSSYYNVDYGNHRGLGDSESTYEIMLHLLDDLKFNDVDEVRC